MEERIIDDEYGRGVRLKRTKDGYVDATDEALETNADETEFEEELAFEFPVFETDEDDEELATLTPEEALALRKKREEDEARRKAEYERLCLDGKTLLDTHSYHAAELKYEKALMLDDVATEASVGYWRAKTENFTQPDVLISEYADSDMDSMEHDLGYEAVVQIRRDYRSVFESRVAEIEKEETPLAKTVAEKQVARRGVLQDRVKRTSRTLAAVGVPALALLIFTVVFGLKNFTVRDQSYIVPTIVFASVFFLQFIVTVLCANKWLNALRMRKANEKLSSTADGARLQRLRSYKALYQELLVSHAQIMQEPVKEQETERENNLSE